MQYGNWELRDDAVYYPAQHVILYPSSNSADEGSIHLESNVRSIVRRVTSKSFKLNENDFHVTVSDDPYTLKVAPGSANIQGYHLIANTPLYIKLPVTTSITAFTLGISLSYDAANNVTGDVVNYTGRDNAVFSGAYLTFFNECHISKNYDNILVIARVWVKDGLIVNDVTIPNDSSSIYAGRYIEKGLENDPANYHSIYGDRIEVDVNGVELNSYDAIRAFPATFSYIDNEGQPQTETRYVPNLTYISNYDTMRSPVELNPYQYTKAPSFTTDLQDVLNYLPDWYTSKYGDYMTGALRFDNLSLDAKMLLDEINAHQYTKDNSYQEGTAKYLCTESVYISPRTLGKLNYRNAPVLSEEALSDLFKDGGTIMTVIPQSYKTIPLDSDPVKANPNNPAYAALTSQSEGIVGLRIQTKHGSESTIAEVDHENSASAKLLIENNSPTTGVAQLSMHDGQIFLDSYNGKGIQLFSGNSSIGSAAIGYRFDDNFFSVSAQNYNSHGAQFISKSSITQMYGHNSEKVYIRAGRISWYSTGRMIADVTGGLGPFIQIGNLMLKSDNSRDGQQNSYQIPTIGPFNLSSERSYTDYNVLPNVVRKIQLFNNEEVELKLPPAGADAEEPYVYPYTRILPGLYTQAAIAEDYVQVGTSRIDDICADDANTRALNKIVIGRTNKDRTDYKDEQPDKAYTFIEQTVPKWIASANPSADKVGSIFTKITPFNQWPDGSACSLDACQYKEIGGIYSYGNIGCSSKLMNQYTGRDATTGPYDATSEWARLTRFRYDNDNDAKYLGGLDAGNPNNNYTHTYGTTYNLEFNTCVANRRANQIIWNYFDNDTNSACQPLTLSYIHDTKTEYPTPQYYDFNGFTHKNPTYSVRDFLRLDGGGLSIHGDVNNPALMNSGEDVSHFGVTIVQGRVYSGVYNDYAETYEKLNPEELAEEGMVVALDAESGKYKICEDRESTLVVGVISDNYGFLIGGKSIDSAKDQRDSMDQLTNFAVGVAGKVYVNVDCDVLPGQLLTSSDQRGLATVCKYAPIPGTIIGKALSKAVQVEGKSYKQCLMQIMLS